ncbi:hypothetical protein [Collimonas silvisoli]|uniref:hypothetical protein n=1 Tax=Collimonas silvisoli TaxID=2825884 RepID=UPI001B8BDF71|nr:hypothetical protein [Collimonas silvisoli]
MERYAEAGISIESNPGSNVYIGQISSHADHPIFRWAPLNDKDLNDIGKYNQFGLRKRRLSVTTNTDDQEGIIPTALRMEHQLIFEGVRDHQHSEAEVTSWIDRIRALRLTHFSSASQVKE